MSALEDGISTVTGDISASMTTTNSIMSEIVWQIKDGICNTNLMEPIASKAINKEAVMFQRILNGFRPQTIRDKCLSLEQWNLSKLGDSDVFTVTAAFK